MTKEELQIQSLPLKLSEANRVAFTKWCTGLGKSKNGY